MRRVRILVLGIALCCSLHAWGQAREVQGTVYSFVGPDGKRTYSSKPPQGKEGFRTIKYTFYEGQKAVPPYIFRCRVGKEDRFFAEPFVGCVVVGSVVQERRAFGGFDCKGDCSGHKAGYDWAAKVAVTDPDRCSGPSQAFVQGCTVQARGLNP